MVVRSLQCVQAKPGDAVVIVPLRERRPPEVVVKVGVHPAFRRWKLVVVAQQVVDVTGSHNGRVQRFHHLSEQEHKMGR